MDVVVPLAQRQGLVFDCLVCADDVAQNRPSPLGMYRCFVDLEVWPAHRVVKVDDTVPGLMEGRHAGCGTVGVAASGNACGLTWVQWSALDEALRASHRERATQQLREAQPDYVIDTVADLLRVVDGMRSIGLEPFLAPRHQAPIIVTFHAPEHPAYDFRRFYAAAKQRGFVLYPGKLTTVETFRVGCIGAIGRLEMQQAVNAVAESLRELGMATTLR